MPSSPFVALLDRPPPGMGGMAPERHVADQQLVLREAVRAAAVGDHVSTNDVQGGTFSRRSLPLDPDVDHAPSRLLAEGHGTSVESYVLLPRRHGPGENQVAVAARRPFLPDPSDPPLRLRYPAAYVVDRELHLQHGGHGAFLLAAMNVGKGCMSIKYARNHVVN